jgi:hypothetical protein
MWEMVDLDSASELASNGSVSEGGAEREKTEKRVYATLAEVVCEESERRVGEAAYVNGISALAVMSDGSLCIGREDGVVSAVMAASTRTVYPDASNDGTFVNAQTPVRMIQMSVNEEIAMIGYNNGGWIHVCMQTGFTTAAAGPHAEFADVFKLVKTAKLSKYTDTAPNCRAMVASEDLNTLYLASPALRDNSIYVWDLKRHMRSDSVERDDSESGASALVFNFDENSIPASSRSGLNELDDVAYYDAWMEQLAKKKRNDAENEANKDVQRLDFHKDGVTALARVGNVLLSGGSDGHIAAWDVKTKSKSGNTKLIPKIPMFYTSATNPVRRLVVSKAGRILYCGCIDGTVRVYDIVGKSTRIQLSFVRTVGGQDGFITSLCTIRNDPFVVTGSAKAKNKASFIKGDGDLCVWRVSDGARMARIAIHDADVTALVVTHDGKTMYSGDAKGKLCKIDLSANAKVHSHSSAGEIKADMKWRKGFLL